MILRHPGQPNRELTLAADDRGLHRILFAKEKCPTPPDPVWRQDSAPLEEPIRQLWLTLAAN